MSVTSQLGVLEGTGLIKLAALQPEVEYHFRHGLVQEAAYFSLVKADRQALHRAVGETLERLYMGQPAHPARELLPELAHHFAEANDARRALDYYTRAADAASGQYANGEAIEHYTHALQFALPDRASAAQLTHLFSRRGRALELSGRYDAALDNYLQWESEAHRRGDRALVLAALTRRVVVHAVPNALLDVPQALELAQTALGEAKALGDREAEVRLHWAVMLAHSNSGDAPAAVRSGERALTLARDLDHQELMAQTLTDLSRMHMSIGRIEESAAELAEAADLWRAVGNLPMLAETNTNTAFLHFYRGDYRQALSLLAEGLAISESIGNAWGQAYNLMQRGFVLFDRGDFSAAMRAMRRCLALSHEGGFVFPLVPGNAMLGMVLGMLGQHEQAQDQFDTARQAAGNVLPTERATFALLRAWLALLQSEVDLAEQMVAECREALIADDHASPYPVILALVTAELALRRGNPQEALQATDPFAGGLQAGIMASFMPDLLQARGAALLATDQRAEAEAVLLQAHTIASSQPSYRSLWPICRLLASIAGRRGDRAAASQWLSAARTHLNYVIEHIDEPVLRASFLQRADVRAALGAE